MLGIIYMGLNLFTTILQKMDVYVTDEMGHIGKLFIWAQNSEQRLWM